MKQHGRCVKAVVTRNVFVYAAPFIPAKYEPPPPLPKPKINYNIVFLKTPKSGDPPEPITAPPPQQKTLVYVLSKGNKYDQKVIEVPRGPQTPPEVGSIFRTYFYVLFLEISKQVLFSAKDRVLFFNPHTKIVQFFVSIKPIWMYRCQFCRQKCQKL